MIELPTVYDVPADIFIKRLASYLKENLCDRVKPLSWSLFAKTGSQTERHPLDLDWWYIRSASLLRKVYMKGPIGISRLRLMYGGRVKGKRRRPEHFRRGGGKIIRAILQQLEDAELVKTVEGGGRIISDKGRSLLDRLAAQIKRELEKEIVELKKY